MTRGLLSWLLVLMFSAPFQAAGDEPQDAYMWLEEVTGEKPLAWVKERNAESTGELMQSDQFQALERRLLEILDSDARIPMISKHGAFYYNFWRDAKNRRGLWRRTTLEEFRKAKPAWEVVLDLDALAKQEKENWVWRGAQFLRPENRLVLVSLSRGGADASVVREFDVAAKSFANDGYALPEAKSQLGWRGHDSVFVGTDFGPGSLTTSGYLRLVKEWKRGTPLGTATVVFEGKPGDMCVSADRDITPGFERDIISRRPTFWTSEYFLRRDGKLIPIAKPDDALITLHREWILIRLRSDWTAGGKTYPAGGLIVAGLESFLKGDRTFEVLFEPTERKSLAAVSPTRHQEPCPRRQ
jgi:prolyl oligopeptidase